MLNFKLYNKKSANQIRDDGDEEANSAADQEAVFKSIKANCFDHASKGKLLATDLGEGADVREAKEEKASAAKRKLIAQDSDSSNNSEELAAAYQT